MHHYLWRSRYNSRLKSWRHEQNDKQKPTIRTYACAEPPVDKIRDDTVTDADDIDVQLCPGETITLMDLRLFLLADPVVNLCE